MWASALKTIGSTTGSLLKNGAKNSAGPVVDRVSSFLNGNNNQQQSQQQVSVESSFGFIWTLLSFFGLSKQTIMFIVQNGFIIILVSSIPLLLLYVLFQTMIQSIPFPTGLQ